MKQWGISAVGTIRQDLIRGCDEVLKNEKELKKDGRGSFCGAVDLNTGITIVNWYDRKIVQLASNFLFTHPIDIVQRWSSKEHKYIEVPRPQIVIVHNKGMLTHSICFKPFIASITKVGRVASGSFFGH